MAEEAEVKKEARIVSPKERSRDVPLDYPVEFHGKVYDTITIRRASAKEVSDFIDAVSKSPDGVEVKAPMIDCPLEVYEAMDDDDRLRLEEALLPFLPLRLKQGVALTLATATPTSEK